MNSVFSNSVNNKHRLSGKKSSVLLLADSHGRNLSSILREKNRDIAVTSVVKPGAGLLEKVVYEKLMKFINKNSILCNEQHGFRNKRSTTTAVYECINSILNLMDKKQETIGVFIDLSKAFDMVDHKILLSKLERYGIRGLSNKWISSFLTNRMQAVCVKHTDIELKTVSNHLSDYKQIKCGVPQGSDSIKRRRR
ncbi:uncharacterized protein LOC124613531 [Schistocerca americana]|uniref:uncharacterized protein LOC124613531 n=1 Tax=Schistocerca americana TaxID=7009 RepID=UPI001F4FB940|nr:uncharacterized protein LOC124613531 [Schistocerca americana]